MKREFLEFLKRERDALAEDLRRLQAGEVRVFQAGSGERDVTQHAAAEIEARLFRFEEIIAASESGLF